PGGPRQRLRRRASLAPAAPAARGLRTRRPGAHAAVAALARADPAPAFPLSAALPRLGRPAARAYAEDRPAAPGRGNGAMSVVHKRARRQRWLRFAFGAFALVVAVLLVRYARGIDWPAVAAALA